MRLLDMANGILSQITNDIVGSGVSAPCDLLKGLNITSASIEPQYSLFSGWSGYFLEITLE